MRGCEDDNEISATQPVFSLLLSGVVAYVEVRSGHDNRSRGVKAQLRNLGATVNDTFTNDVTHVVFNEGLPSTYKKAQKLKCHLVSVLWIEACKEQLTKVSEAAYPPIGKQIYDNPRSLKNFKKLKSMQPDFDEEVDALKTNKILKQIQRKRQKAKPDAHHENLSLQIRRNHGKSKKERRKKSSPLTGSKKKPALREIIPDLLNHGNVNIDSELPFAMEAGNRPQSLLSESVSSSSSVVFLGEELEASPSIINPKRLIESNVSRADFVDGLSKIVFSLSKESNKETDEVYSWGKNPPVSASELSKKKSLPVTSLRRSPRYAASSSHSPVALQRSPRHLEDLVSKKSVIKTKLVSPSCVSASAALNRKHKKLPPTSGDEDFLLLSQEPGDMPTIDEMVKTNKVSIHVGEEEISLSQVVRAYDAVAKEQLKSSSQSSESIYLSCQGTKDNKDVEEKLKLTPEKQENNACAVNNSLILNSEESSYDAEIARHCENRSDAESSVSSFSTKVLINGVLTEPCKVSKLSSTLPGLEEGTCENISHQLNDDLPSENIREREPSPIFIIKKPKFRKPLRKFSGCSTPLTPVQTDAAKNPRKASEHRKEDALLSSSEQSKNSLNPIDYINKLFLPKFLTPAAKEEEVFVDETPDVSCPSRPGAVNIVIPPTPTENFHEPEVKQSHVPQSPSFTSSVLSWVKKSCKVPLFASRTHTVLESTSADITPILPAGSSSDKYNISQRSNSCGTPSGADCTILKSKTDTSPGVLKEESTSPSVTRNERVSPPLPLNHKSVRNSKIGDKVTKVQADFEDCNTLKRTARKRGRVVVLVEKNEDVDSSHNIRGRRSLDKKSSSTIISNKTEDMQSSSGYDTSHSNHSNHDERKSLLPSEMNMKRKKAAPSMSVSVAKGEAKKRSEVYDCDQASTQGQSNDDKEPSTRKSGRKRTRASQSLDCKKPRLTHSPSESKGSDLIEVSSKNRTKSQSFESAKPFERKSSEEAKKRMAKSLTRMQAGDVAKVIVCTFLTASEQNGIDIAGDLLLGWKHEIKVTARTTHVINSGPKRTLNMLKGMVRGCWLVNQNWMLDSAKSGYWLSEEKYELIEFSPAVKQCRLKRQLLGKEFKHSLLSKAGPIFLSPKTESPPAKDVRELLELCSADIKTTPNDCKIIVGEKLNIKGSFKCVSPLWVLDCITKNKILPLNTYLMK